MKSMKWARAIIIGLAILVVGGLATSKPNQVVAQGKVRWKLQSAFLTATVIVGPAGKYFSDLLELGSGGRVKMELYDAGHIVAPFGIFEAVRSGKIEAG